MGKKRQSWPCITAKKMRVSALLLSSTKFVKESTGIVGLRVVPNAREVLIALYEKMLRDVQVCVSSSLLYPEHAAALARLSDVGTHSLTLHTNKPCIMQIIPSHVQYRQAIEQLAARNLDILHENTEVLLLCLGYGVGRK